MSFVFFSAITIFFRFAFIGGVFVFFCLLPFIAVKEHTMLNIKTSFIIVLFNFYFQYLLFLAVRLFSYVIPNHRLFFFYSFMRQTGFHTCRLSAMLLYPILSVQKKSTMKNLCFTRRFVCFEWIMEMSCNQDCALLLLRFFCLLMFGEKISLSSLGRNARFGKWPDKNSSIPAL